MCRKKISYKYKEITYTKRGNSEKTLIFLHGYLEDYSVWDSFTNKGFEKFKILQIDLLGHGGSGATEKASIDEMAEAVRAVMDYENVQQACLIGHSMGGYVSLALTENYPNRVHSFVLMHSTAIADEASRIKSRNRAIKMVKDDKKELIINTAIPMAFAASRVDEFKTELEELKNQARRVAPENMIFALSAMRDRPDRTHVLKRSKKPHLIVIGEQDQYLDYESSIKQLYWSNKSAHIILKDSGHMGFIEEPETLKKAFLTFLNQYYV